MTKIPKTLDDSTSDREHLGAVSAVNNRKSNYKSQKPLLEKRRRDRINNSLDELKSLLLAIKQRDPLRYARLEKADILEMVVKHLKDIKKRRQAMITAMEPILLRSYKMGYFDCTRATIDFINEIESTSDKRQQIVDHISAECMKTFQSQFPPASFAQHHEIMFANVNPPSSESFVPFSLMPSFIESDFETPSLEERLGFSPIGKTSFLLPELKPMPELLSLGIKKADSECFGASLLKIAEPKQSVFCSESKNQSSTLDSPSTSGNSFLMDETPQRTISIHNISSDDDDDDDDDDEKLLIDDQNNNQLTWRPWL